MRSIGIKHRFSSKPTSKLKKPLMAVLVTILVVFHLESIIFLCLKIAFIFFVHLEFMQNDNLISWDSSPVYLCQQNLEIYYPSLCSTDNTCPNFVDWGIKLMNPKRYIVHTVSPKVLKNFQWSLVEWWSIGYDMIDEIWMCPSMILVSLKFKTKGKKIIIWKR